MTEKCPKCGSKMVKSEIKNEAKHTHVSCTNCEHGYVEGR